MKAILVNDDKSLRWDEVPYPILSENDVSNKWSMRRLIVQTSCKERVIIRRLRAALSGWGLKFRVKSLK